MDKLVKEIIKPFLMEDTKIKKIVGIYGGRFQPFGPHHLKTYKWLAKQVDEAYITTSNLKKPPRHPMNYKEKVRHMANMGVPSNKIIQEKSPYVAKNLMNKFDEETTAFVYVFGAKDTGRLGGGGKYFQDFKKNKKNLKGHKHHGYYLVAPHVSIRIGSQEVSGTAMRTLLGSPKIDDSDRAKLFKKMFGYFNQGVFNMMTNKFKKLFSEQVDEDINIPVKVGDTVLMGKFKNKKVKIKKIGKDKHGMPTINGKKAATFRIHKIVNIFDEDVDTIKKGGKDGGEYRDYEDPPDSDWDEPHKHRKNIEEASPTSASPADDGPSAYFKKDTPYKIDAEIMAGKLGMEVVDYILGGKKNMPVDTKYPKGPVGSVSYFPAGVGAKATATNQENLWGSKAWNKWLKHMKTNAENSGYDIMDYFKYVDWEKELEELEKEAKKHTKNTIKGSKEETPPDTKIKESLFSPNWWEKELLKEKLVNRSVLKPRKKELLLMGGAYGHMAHPFDDKNLTFGDLKKIITNGLGGQLNREDNVTEKLDGQNIMISWKDGKLIAARNKGHIKNGGKTALDAKGVRLKFAGRGDIADAFNFAMTDLGKAIGSLSEKQRTKIFNNGYNFMNLEVMWPNSANVINYDIAELVFHGALKYDDSGKVIGEVPGSGRILAGMIQQRNQNIQKKYKIKKPVILDIPKHQDFGKMKAKYLGKLSKLQSKFGMSDSDTLALYHQYWWSSFVKGGEGKHTAGIPNKIEKKLVKRWAFFDKSYKIPQIKKDLKKFPKFLEWVLKVDKQDHAKQVKENMKPFEELFFEVGAEILKNVSGYIAANPDKAVRSIRAKLRKAVKAVRAGGDLKKLNTLRLQLDKLHAIGGISSIVPTEGIVFKYKGNTYKFTGTFAPVNQITGLMSF